MGKAPCCEKHGLKKGPWAPEEDKKLLAYIERHGHGSWRALPSKAGLQRCGKSCRLRWRNYLRPDIKRGKFNRQEEQTIIQLHALLGNRWSAIAAMLPSRTDNEIKNYWNTHLKKKLSKLGIDPVTHRPKGNNTLGSGQNKDIANLNHIAQWESARVEAEARLVRDSKVLVSNPHHLPFTSSSLQLLSKAVVPLSSSKQPIMPLPCLDILKNWQGVRANPNAFLNFNVGNLGSPKSPLHFSDNMFNAPSAGLGESSVFLTTNKIENLKPHEVVTTKESVQRENANDKTKGMLLHEVGSFPVDATCITDSPGIPSFLEGFTGDLHWDDAEVLNITGLYDNNILGSFCSGNLEENKKSWNTLL